VSARIRAGSKFKRFREMISHTQYVLAYPRGYANSRLKTTALEGANLSHWTADVFSDDFCSESILFVTILLPMRQCMYIETRRHMCRGIRCGKC
jgi:hypothetical protein